MRRACCAARDVARASGCGPTRVKVEWSRPFAADGTDARTARRHAFRSHRARPERASGRRRLRAGSAIARGASLAATCVARSASLERELAELFASAFPRGGSRVLGPRRAAGRASSTSPSSSASATRSRRASQDVRALARGARPRRGAKPRVPRGADRRAREVPLGEGLERGHRRARLSPLALAPALGPARDAHGLVARQALLGLPVSHRRSPPRPARLAPWRRSASGASDARRPPAARSRDGGTAAGRRRRGRRGRRSARRERATAPGRRAAARAVGLVPARRAGRLPRASSCSSPGSSSAAARGRS